MSAPIVIPAIGDDGALYPIEKMEAHRRGVLHLAVSVFVFSDGELLIQQRAAGKYHCGLQWANTCCTHPHWGEDLATVGQRRLGEELGLTLRLAPAGVLQYAADVTAGLREHERVHVYAAGVDRAAVRPAPDPAEVGAVRWAAPGDLRREADAEPDAFAPWFRIYLERWPELGLG
jgi:isopentenyl-diphosphate delta-isomerase